MTIQSLVNSALLLLLQIAVVSGLILLKRWKLQMEAYYAKQTTVQQRELLALVGNEAFHYAEQVFAQHDGPAKLNEAVKYVLDRATSHRLQVTYPEVRAVIEKAWAEFEIQKSQKQAA
ncbi:phage holin [Tumebacillus permanentifrigoris]|nr:phage holin [Tumebacillus permanentifrigoris]